MSYASVPLRLAALLIDTAIPTVLLYALMWSGFLSGGLDGALAGYLVGLFVVVAYGLVIWGMLATSGTSPGMRLLSIRIVRADTGGAPGWGRALGRLVLRSLMLGVTAGIAGFSAYWDPERQRRTWWDRVVGTLAVGKGSMERADRYPSAGSDERRTTGQGPLPHSGSSWDTPVPVAPKKSFNPGSEDDTPGSERPSAPWGSEFRSITPAERVAAAEPSVDIPRSWTAPVLDATGVITAVPGRVGPGEPESQQTQIAHRRPQAGPATPATSGLMIRFDSGETNTVESAALIGRDPAVSLGDENSLLIPLFDSTLSVSKTHLKLEKDGSEIWVTDRHSTNGVEIHTAGEMLQCEPGVRSVVPPNATVVFGQRSLTIATNE